MGAWAGGQCAAGLLRLGVRGRPRGAPPLCLSVSGFLAARAGWGWGAEVQPCCEQEEAGHESAVAFSSGP